MNNKYFGDVRDAFKYDLICEILGNGLAKHFTLIPMLTERSNKPDGEKRDFTKAIGRESIINFLRKFDDEDTRDIEHLKQFRAFEGKITIYKPDEFPYFNHSERKEYFAGIPDKALASDTIILIDPDKGLEIKKSKKEHLKYCEVKDLFKRMGEKSTLMIYQHFPRNEKHDKYLKRRREEIKNNITGGLPHCISDSDVILFFITKYSSLDKLIGSILGDYAIVYRHKIRFHY